MGLEVRVLLHANRHTRARRPPQGKNRALFLSEVFVATKENPGNGRAFVRADGLLRYGHHLHCALVGNGFHGVVVAAGGAEDLVLAVRGPPPAVQLLGPEKPADAAALPRPLLVQTFNFAHEIEVRALT